MEGAHSNAQNYRAEAAEFARRADEATLLKDIKEFRQRARALNDLAKDEEWRAANAEWVAVAREKATPNRAPDDGRIGDEIADDHS
jgi:hypothetical protein